MGSTPLELSTGAIHHSACLSVGLQLTVAIYLNVIGSKLERSSEQRSGGRGSSGVSHRPQQGTEKWGAGWREVVKWGCRGVAPPPSWEHSGGVKEARELRSNLGVKWKVLCPGKGCQVFTVSHSYRKGWNLRSSPGVLLCLKEPTSQEVFLQAHSQDPR